MRPSFYDRFLCSQNFIFKEFPSEVNSLKELAFLGQVIKAKEHESMREISLLTPPL